MKHQNNTRSVLDCACPACSDIIRLVGDLALELQASFGLRSAAVELQRRLENSVRVYQHGDNMQIQIIRKDGSPSLWAPLDRRDRVGRVLRLRGVDLCRSILKRKEFVDRKPLYEDSTATNRDDDPADVAEESEMRALTRAALNSLEPLTGAILVLRHVESFSRLKVATILDMTPKTVLGREAKGLATLRDVLARHVA